MRSRILRERQRSDNALNNSFSLMSHAFIHTERWRRAKVKPRQTKKRLNMIDRQTNIVIETIRIRRQIGTDRQL